MAAWGTFRLWMFDKFWQRGQLPLTRRRPRTQHIWETNSKKLHLRNLTWENQSTMNCNAIWQKFAYIYNNNFFCKTVLIIIMWKFFKKTHEWSLFCLLFRGSQKINSGTPTAWELTSLDISDVDTVWTWGEVNNYLRSQNFVFATNLIMKL